MRMLEASQLANDVCAAMHFLPLSRATFTRSLWPIQRADLCFGRSLIVYEHGAARVSKGWLTSRDEPFDVVAFRWSSNSFERFVVPIACLGEDGTRASAGDLQRKPFKGTFDTVVPQETRSGRVPRHSANECASDLPPELGVVLPDSVRHCSTLSHR